MLKLRERKQVPLLFAKQAAKLISAENFQKWTKKHQKSTVF